MNESRIDPAANEPHRAQFADVTPHRQFEYRWNQLQRAIEVMAAVVIVLALIGLLGTGPLSSARASAPSNDFGVRYDRIMRRTVQSKVVFQLTKPAVGNTLTVVVPNTFLDRVSVQGMQPRASSMRAEAEGIAYGFDLGTMHKGRITLDLKPSTAAFYSATFRVDGEPVTLHQIILP